MRLCAGSRCGLVCCIIAMIACAVTGDDSAQTGSNVRYVTHDDRGRRTAEILGDSATMLPNNDIEITSLRLMIYNEDGTENARVKASKCVWRLNEGVAESDSDVRIEGNKMVITGVGFKWNSGDRRFSIRKQARVEIQDMKSIDEQYDPFIQNKGE